MQYVWTVLILAVALIAIGAILCFRLISNLRKRNGMLAALGYLAFAAGLFYIDVIGFEQRWAVPIYVVCFVVMPLVVYYVVSALTEEYLTKKAGETSSKAPSETLKKSKQKKKAKHFDEKPKAVREPAQATAKAVREPATAAAKAVREPAAAPVKATREQAAQAAAAAKAVHEPAATAKKAPSVRGAEVSVAAQEKAPVKAANIKTGAKLDVEKMAAQQRSSNAPEIKQVPKRKDSFSRVGDDFAEKVFVEAKAAQPTVAIPVQGRPAVATSAAKINVPEIASKDAVAQQARPARVAAPTGKRRVPIPTAAQTLEVMNGANVARGVSESAEREKAPVVKVATKASAPVFVNGQVAATASGYVPAGATTKIPRIMPTGQVVVTEAPKEQAVQVEQIQKTEAPSSLEPSANKQQVLVASPAETVEKAKNALEEYQTYFDKAMSVMEQGFDKVAALLFANCATLEVNSVLQKKALFEEIACYVKMDKSIIAVEKIEALSMRQDLSAAEMTKIKALLLLVGKQRA